MYAVLKCSRIIGFFQSWYGTPVSWQHFVAFGTRIINLHHTLKKGEGQWSEKTMEGAKSFHYLTVSGKGSVICLCASKQLCSWREMHCLFYMSTDCNALWHMFLWLSLIVKMKPHLNLFDPLEFEICRCHLTIVIFLFLLYNVTHCPKYYQSSICRTFVVLSDRPVFYIIIKNIKNYII